jgi:hypothetical protein
MTNGTLLINWYPALTYYRCPVVPVPIVRLRRLRQRQSIVHRDVYGVLGRHYAPQYLGDYVASIGIYR